MQTTSVHGRRVDYWDLNPAPDKPAIVMLHGFRGSGDALLDTARLLPDFRVVIPNLPGAVGSEPLRHAHSVPNLRTWLDEFLRVTRTTDATIWGHSYGGALALAHAASATHLPRATVSVAPTLPSGGLPGLIPTCYFTIGRLLPLPLQRAWIASGLVNWMSGRFLLRTRHRARRAELIRQGRECLATLDPRAVIDQYLSSRVHPLSSYTDGIANPVLLVGGADDELTPPETLRSLSADIPGSRLVVLSDQGHLAPLEDPESVAQVTRGFLLGHSQENRPG